MAKRFEKYGLWWDETKNPLSLEMDMITEGGRFKRPTGKIVGMGLEYHYKQAIQICWPTLIWHPWLDLMLKEWLEHRYVGIMGPKNSGKSCFAAFVHLMTYYCFPTCTTIIICSDTRDRLEDRIWGEMKKFHRQAIGRFRWLPGHLIEGKQRIVTDDRSEAEEGRDFRNGIMGVPCKKGGQYVGISSFVGIKNKRLYLCGDELSLLPKAFIDAGANLMSANQERKMTGMGNPADTIDALGLLCEPAAHLGGWDSGIDQSPKTKTWETRWPRGVCIQLCGSDSPNMGVPATATPPFPFLISKRDMEDDAKVWGVDDWHYTMFNEARMPRGQGSRRVITRQMCQKFGALNPAVWQDTNQRWIAFLDAAYRGVGGDRCVFGRLRFGVQAAPQVDIAQSMLQAIVTQKPEEMKGEMILELVDMAVIPISVGSPDLPEDQIVKFVKEKCLESNIGPDNFFFDAGMKTSLVTAFGRLWSPKVNSIDFGGKPTERKVSHNIDVSCRDYYSKFVTELWYSVRLVIEAGQFRGMTEDVMLEGCAREWKKVGDNKIEVETKEEMKLKTGRSPDLFDALACGVEGARQRGFIIKRLEAVAHRRTDDRWKRELRDKAKTVWHSKDLVYRN